MPTNSADARLLKVANKYRSERSECRCVMHIVLYISNAATFDFAERTFGRMKGLYSGVESFVSEQGRHMDTSVPR